MTNLVKLTPENTQIMTQDQLDEFLTKEYPGVDSVYNDANAFPIYCENQHELKTNYRNVFDRNMRESYSTAKYEAHFPKEVIVIKFGKLGFSDSPGSRYIFFGITDTNTGKSVNVLDGTWYMCKCTHHEGLIILTQIAYPSHNMTVPLSGSGITCACRYCNAGDQSSECCVGCQMNHCDCYERAPINRYDFENRLDGYGHTEATKFDKPESRTSVLHMGAELEVECECDLDDYNDLANAVVWIRSNTSAVCKRDGSLDYGFENATQPRTVENLKKELWDIAEICLNAGADLYGANHAGLHFHMDMNYLTGREDFTSLRSEYTKMTAFILVESLYQDERMHRLDDRENREYCRIKSNESTHKLKDKGMKYMGLMGQQDDDRYAAVNCTNSSTIELRFFNGTLKEDYLKMAVDVAAAIAYLIRTLDIDNVLSFSFQKFVNFIVKCRKTYPDAYAYLKSNKLLKPIEKSSEPHERQTKREYPSRLCHTRATPVAQHKFVWCLVGY